MMLRVASFVLFLGCLATTDALAGERRTWPQVVALREIHKLTAAGNWPTLYNDFCHPHLKKQMSEEEFAKYMVSEEGKEILALFEGVLAAIEAKAIFTELITRYDPNDATVFEFILPAVRRKSLRASQQWHVELQLDNGNWKLLDTD